MTDELDKYSELDPARLMRQLTDLMARVRALEEGGGGEGGGSVSVTDAGNGNIVVNPSPGVGTFTLDVGEELTNVSDVNSSPGQSLQLSASNGDADGSSGPNTEVSAATGNSNSAGRGGDGGSAYLYGRDGGNSTGGDGDGGDGGSVYLYPGNGGSKNGTGTPGDGGYVKVSNIAVFDSAGHLLADGFPTTDQNDGETVWVDLTADRVLKLSSAI